MIENRRSVLCSDVRSLPVHLCRIVHVPERFHQRFVTHFRRVKRHLHHFRMPCPIRADFLVRWLLGLSPAVPDNRIFHAWDHPELRFDSPKATRRKRCNFTHFPLPLSSILSILTSS